MCSYVCTQQLGTSRNIVKVHWKVFLDKILICTKLFIRIKFSLKNFILKYKFARAFKLITIK